MIPVPIPRRFHAGDVIRVAAAGVRRGKYRIVEVAPTPDGCRMRLETIAACPTHWVPGEG